jgi:NAD(P)-dependent dehydrogenase (short-subunit alcohol dehydrogenase family)
MSSSGQTVVVTGGLGALGRAVCANLSHGGWRVVVIDAATRDANAPEGEYDAIFAPVDLRDADALARTAESIRAQGFAVGALVNIAGGFRWEKLADGQIATWDWLYEVNLKTALTACKTFLPDLAASGGRIVNIGAAAAAKAGLGMGAYAASKSGVLRLTEALAEELKDNGVNVNAILPGIIDTPANRRDLPKADHSRWVAPEALAEVVAFLLSDASRAVTGVGIPVTGRL